MSTQTAVLQEREPVRAVTISYEVVAYAALLGVALVLRLLDLGSVAITQAEAHEALAAWRALYPHTAGSLIVSQSPLLFLLHSTAFLVFGGTEFGVRVFTALAGAGLALSPLLFRPLLGVGRAFLLSLILALSPIMLIASRFDSPVIWAIWAALLGLWALWRWWQSDRLGYALLAGAAFAGLLFLTDPLGWVYALVLLIAGLLALGWQRLEAPDADMLPVVRDRLSDLPWTRLLLAGAVTLFVVATLGMSYLPGLSSVGKLLGQGLSGITTQDFKSPSFFALLTTLFYEPWLWLFALLGLWLLRLRGGLNLLERFLAAWGLLAAVVPLLYQGTSPAHGLWITLPLAGLTSALLVELIQTERHPYLLVPGWLKPLGAACTIVILTLMAVSLQAIARMTLQTPDGSLTGVTGNLIGPLVVVMGLLLIGAGYLLISSMWGTAVALRVGALGLFGFALLTSMGSGWNATVTQAENPVEFWQTNATGRETALLRDTFLELDRRESGGFPYLTAYVQADDGGIVAWLLRDFVNVQYIQYPSEARTQQIALLPASNEPPALLGSYVGEDFVIQRTWRMESMQGFDFLSWWMQRRVRAEPAHRQSMVLWLRQDVYDGVDFVFNP